MRFKRDFELQQLHFLQKQCKAEHQNHENLVFFYANGVELKRSMLLLKLGALGRLST